MRNIDRLKSLARFIEDAYVKTNVPAMGFNMKSLARDDVPDTSNPHYCGTVACLGGWHLYRQYRICTEAQFSAFCAGFAAHNDRDAGGRSLWRGLIMPYFGDPEDFDDLSRLFHLDGMSYSSTNATGKQAVAVLRHYADSGIVDWGRFDHEGKDLTEAAALPTAKEPEAEPATK